MTLREWHWIALRYWFAFLCGASFVYLVVSALIEHKLEGPKDAFTWWHPRLLAALTALMLLAGNLLADELLPERPKPQKLDVDESIVEEVRQHLRGGR